jgi:outer membrane protein OmpA-like peptidoglycan-associated protein
LLIAGSYIIDKKLETGLFITHRITNGWSYPEKLNIKNFYFLSPYISFNLSSDGNTLLMSIEREDSYGKRDIYVSFWLGDNSWTEPKNLGDVINTVEDEESPFLSADGVTMYFSSKGHGGYGDYDVFRSKRLDDTWQKWSLPENLGDQVNTPAGDGNYIIPANGNYAYYASTDSTIGGWDIFRITLPKDAKPDPVVLLSGLIIDPVTLEPLDARIYYETLEGKELGSARTNPATGEYKLVLPIGDKYQICVESDEYSTDTQIDATGVFEYREITYNPEFDDTNNGSTRIISVRPNPIRNLGNIDFFHLSEDTEIPEDLDKLPIEIVQREVFDKINVYFDYNQYPVKDFYHPDLKYLIKILKAYPIFHIEIVGHTDELGSEAFNYELSVKRATAVADLVINKEVPDSRITIIGAGRLHPIAENTTEEGRALNRRVEFKVSK